MYSYESTLQAALKIDWRVEDLIGPGKSLDFSKPFLPESLVRSQTITCLTPQEQLILNQIRGNSYLNLFILVEQFIIPTVLDQLKDKGFEDIVALQALLCFAEEEGKHIQLFQEFTAAFKQGFITPCFCLEPLSEITQAILQYPPLSVLLLTLQFEWTTQSHYLETVRDNSEENLDPQFCNLLKHHWLEEAQHTKLDTLLIRELTQRLNQSEIDSAIADYLRLVDLLHHALMQQMQLDIRSLVAAIGRDLTQSERQELQRIQEQSYRWSFLCAGITHPNFVQVLNEISPAGKNQVMAVARAFS
jgi:hypothetical protein